MAYIGNNGKSNGNYYNIGGYMGIKDKKMEAPILGYIVFRVKLHVTRGVELRGSVCCFQRPCAEAQ